MNKYCECYSHYRQEFNNACQSCGGSGTPGNTRVKQLEAKIERLEAQLAVETRRANEYEKNFGDTWQIHSREKSNGETLFWWTRK